MVTVNELYFLHTFYNSSIKFRSSSLFLKCYFNLSCKQLYAHESRRQQDQEHIQMYYMRSVGS